MASQAGVILRNVALLQVLARLGLTRGTCGEPRDGTARLLCPGIRRRHAAGLLYSTGEGGQHGRIARRQTSRLCLRQPQAPTSCWIPACVPRQLALIALLLLMFAFELAGGIDLILNPHSAGAAGLVSNLLVGLLIIGIARAWELVGDRATGIIASITVLTGHDHNPMPPPASAIPDPAAETGRAGDPRPSALTGADDRPQ
jgi:hypothetical protein